MRVLKKHFLVLFIILVFSGCSVNDNLTYYYDEYEGDIWGNYKEMNIPVYFGETKTVEKALVNAEKAIKVYYGEKEDTEKHKPFGLNYFIDENTWLIITEYEPGKIGGGISFIIDGETGELSSYELNE